MQLIYKYIESLLNNLYNLFIDERERTHKTNGDSSFMNYYIQSNKRLESMQQRWWWILSIEEELNGFDLKCRTDGKQSNEAIHRNSSSPQVERF